MIAQYYNTTPFVGIFLVLSIGKFHQFLTPYPLEIADVLNKWSLTHILQLVTWKLAFSLDLEGKFEPNVGSNLYVSEQKVDESKVAEAS